MNALTAPLPLAEVLGTSWRVDARATAIVWDGAAGAAWFGLDDGSVAIARTAWEGRPSARARPGGGAELVPASVPAPSIARIQVHQGACLALAADPDGGILSGGADGELARVAADGVIDTLARFEGMPAAPLATGRGGWRVCAAGSVLVRVGVGAKTLELPHPITALAVAPNGARVAIGQANGVTLWAGGDAPRVLEGEGAATALIWNKDSRVLASTTEAGEVLVWDVAGDKPRALGDERETGRRADFLADGRVVSSIGGAVLCWQLATGEAERCGAGNRDRVVQLACHPRRTLIAAGYGNGAVVICRPGHAEIVMVRGAGAGPIDALSWSPSGDALAYGAGGGALSVVALPGLLFRDGGPA